MLTTNAHLGSKGGSPIFNWAKKTAILGKNFVQILKWRIINPQRKGIRENENTDANLLTIGLYSHHILCGS